MGAFDSADEAAMTEIQAAILGEETQELSTLARQHAILLTLLQTKEPVSMHYFLKRIVLVIRLFMPILNN